MGSGSGLHKTCKRFNVPGDAHELTFSCHEHRPFLNVDRHCGYLSQAISRAREKHSFHLWAYVFMPEHVHLLIWPTTEVYSISRILQSIKQSVSREAIRHLRKHDPDELRWMATGQKDKPYRFWLDGGGYDRNMTSREVLVHAVEYIHNNPVRRGLVSSPEVWFWSSAREWVDPGAGPMRIDRESFPSM